MESLKIIIAGMGRELQGHALSDFERGCHAVLEVTLPKLQALVDDAEKCDLVKKLNAEIAGLRRVAANLNRGNSGDQSRETRAYNNHTAGVLEEVRDELAMWLPLHDERIRAEARLEGRKEEHKLICAHLAAGTIRTIKEFLEWQDTRISDLEVLAVESAARPDAEREVEG